MLEGSKSLAIRKISGPNKSFSQNASLFTLAKHFLVPSNVVITIIVVIATSSAEGRVESDPMVLFNDLSAILRSQKNFHIITGP